MKKIKKILTLVKSKKLIAIFLLILSFCIVQYCKAGSIFDNFNDGNTEGWISLARAPWHPLGNWRIEDKILLQDAGGDNHKFLLNDFSISSQSVEVMLKANNYGGSGGIIIWYQDYNNYVNVLIYPSHGILSGLLVVENINGDRQISSYPYTYANLKWYKLRINADSLAGKIDVYVDDVYLFTYNVTTSNRTGWTGLNTGNSGGYFDDFSLISGDIPPTSKQECKNGDWMAFSLNFKNQGACVSYVESNENAGKKLIYLKGSSI